MPLLHNVVSTIALIAATPSLGGAGLLAGSKHSRNVPYHHGVFNNHISAADNIDGQKTYLNEINVTDYGVVGDGISDDAPAFRRIFAGAAGKKIIIPGGKIYKLCSTVAPGYPAFNEAAIKITQQDDFSVEAAGASFVTCDRIAFSTIILFDQCKKFSWKGGNFIGNRTGVHENLPQLAFALANNIDGIISKIYAKGFGGGTFAAGDYNAKVIFEDIFIDGAGTGFDFAFFKDLTIRRVRAIGSDHDQNMGPGHTGQKFYSMIYDKPLLGNNKTGINLDDAENIIIEDSEISNYQTAFYISSGKNQIIRRNKCHNNPGFKTAGGICIFITYNNEGMFSSQNHPAKDISIYENDIANNGLSSPGYAIIMDPKSIINSDIISDIKIFNNIFHNNSKIAIGLTDKSNLKNLHIWNNKFSGSEQHQNLDDNVKQKAIQKSP